MKSKSTRHPRKSIDGHGLKIALVVSDFNAGITSKLKNGALECLRVHGVADSDVVIYSCPGAFELPQVASKLAQNIKCDAIICLGAVIRGDTPHFEYVSGETARGIQQVALSYHLPVAFGVLTTDNMKQAKERSGGKYGNKGWEAALTAIEMSLLFGQIKSMKSNK